MNILFTCAGRRNYLINYFKEAIKDERLIFAADMQLNAPALVDADVAVKAPSIYDEDYIEFLLQICKKNKIEAIISLNDLELPILSENKQKFLAVGTRVLVSNSGVINITFDKWETVKFLEKNNLKTPKTYIELSEAKKALKSGKLFFPLVVKPRWGSASIAVDFAQNEEELDLVYQLQLIKLKRSILANVSNKNIERSILIQEKIQGVEYGMDVLNTFDQKYYATFAREKVSMRSGETDKAVSVIDEQLTKIGQVIGGNLKHIGNLDCDVFYDGEDYFVLELNPRFGGGYPFSHQAGVNTPAIYLEWLKGNEDIEQFNCYKSGIAFAKCDRLLNVSDK